MKTFASFLVTPIFFGTFFVGTFLFRGPSVARAEDSTPEKKGELKEVVVTANRLETPVSKVGSSITVISKEEIEKKKQFSVLEILKSVPGVDVVRSGGSGGNTAVFLRGANSEHTLVLIDGAEVNNPINPQRSFNFADLTLDNIERIEVLRGPQTTLYGSDAMGGVIQIITKKGGKEPHMQLSTEVGSYDTYREAASAQGSLDTLNYSMGFSRTDRQGMSAVTNPLGDAENDKYENTTGSARLGLEVLENLSFDVTGRITNSHSEIDDGPGSGDDDPNRLLNSNQYSTRATANLGLFSGLLKQTYGVSYTGTRFEDNNDPDPQHTVEKLRSNYKGQQVKFDLQNTLQLSDDDTFVAGFETEEEKGSSTLASESEFGPFNSDFSEKEVRTNGMYGQFGLEPIENLNVALGGRVDDNSIFGTRENWRLAPSYFIEASGTRVKGSIGTAYKAPSLYQLYSEFGALDLQPERSLGFDGGFEQDLLNKKVTFGVTYFHNNFKDLISFDPNTFIFQNILKARTEGFESFLQVSPLETLDLRVSHTFLDTRDDSTGLRLLRRAKQKFDFNASYRCSEQVSTQANLLVVGTRADNDFSAFPAKRIQLPVYALLNVAVEYKLNKTFSFFGRGDNIFDKDYQEIFGYNTPGATFYGGVKVGL